MDRPKNPANVLKLRKPKTLLFDISGTIIKTSFVDKVLFPYINKDNVKKYLLENWDTEFVQLNLKQLQVVNEQDDNAPKIKATEQEREQLATEVATYVQYCKDTKTDNNEFIQLRLKVWLDAYQRGRIQTPVYSDSAIQMKDWHTKLGLQMVVVSNGWTQANMLFMQKTNHGNVHAFIKEYFDTEEGSLTEFTTYQKILDKLKRSQSEVLFLTKDAAAGQAATRAGISVVLVLTHRSEVKRLDEFGKTIPKVRSLLELEFY